MALLLYVQRPGEMNMDKPRQSQTTSPFGEHGDRREPAPAARQVFAAENQTKDVRLTDPPVAIDGQLVEAGYGHGV